jgi:hypothetical protein
LHAFYFRGLQIIVKINGREIKNSIEITVVQIPKRLIVITLKHKFNGREYFGV